MFNFKQLSAYGQALKTTTTDIGELSRLTSLLTTEQTLNALSSKGLEKQQVIQILMNKGIVQSEAEAIASKMASTTANGVATFSMQAYTTAIWTNIKAIGAWILSNPVGWIIGIGTAIIGAVAAFNYFNETIEEQKEKISELKDEYENTVQELETLGDEIETNDKRISELTSKVNNNTITLIEEDELKKLSIANDLLKEQQIVLENTRKNESIELADKNRKTFTEEYGSDINTELQSNIGAYSLYGARVLEGDSLSNKDLILSIEALYAGIDEAIVNGDEDTTQSLTEGQDYLVSILQERSNTILSELLEYQNTLSQIMNADGTFNNPADQQMWDWIEDWKKVIYQYSGNSGEWNTLQIQAALDEESLQNMQKELSERLKDGTLTEDDVLQYDNLNEALQDANLILTDGQTPASVYLQYLNSIATSQAEVNSTVPDFSFNASNNEGIDLYQSQLTSLNDALKQISTGSLTSGGLLDLLQEFPELTGKTDDLSSAIQILIDDKLAALKDALKAEGASDDILALFDNLTNEVQNFSLDEILSQLEESHSSLEDVKAEVKKTKKISVETLQDITSKYPDLTNVLNDYLEDKASEGDIIAALEAEYATDLDNYKTYILQKKGEDAGFYDQVLTNISEDLQNQAEVYGIKLKDYKTYNEAKLALDKEYQIKKERLEQIQNSLDDTFESMEQGRVVTPNEIVRKQTLEQKAKKELEEYEKFLENFDTSLKLEIPQFTTSYKKDTETEDDKNDQIETIDWADQSLQNLQRTVDKYQTILDNTSGYKNQLDAINALNAALGELQNGYKEAAEEYGDRYTDALKKIPNSKKIKSLIETGEEFDISTYSGDNVEIAKAIQEAIDAYNAQKDAEEKAQDLGQQIADNETLEKSRIRQQKYETDLDIINDKLNSSTLSVQEKNDLLDEQYETQKKINDELRTQAEYTGDLETITKLNEEDKLNELNKNLDQLKNNRELNQKYIDNYKQALTSTDLTSDEINGLNKSLKDATDKDFEYQFKEIRSTISDDVWDTYIQGLKKQYKETKLSDKAFVKKHIKEIASYFDYTGMEQWLGEYFASNEEYDRTTYDTTKNTRTYTINSNNNKIQDIQNDIDLNGGIGTEKQYSNMIKFYQSNMDIWQDQLEDAQTVLANTTPNTQAWDEANAEVQELENNIYDCDAAIKKCNTSILELPLREVQDILDDISDSITEIDKQIAEQDTYISAVNIILDEQISFQEKQKDVIQEQIDELQKEHDLRESNLNIQKLEYALQRAKNNTVNKVFKEGQGFVFEADADEVNEAQHALDEAIYNQKITQLQNQINTYDEEIDRLNDIKESFNTIKSDTEELLIYNKAIAYDASFVNKVLSSDVALITTFKNTYQELLTNKDLYEDQQENYSGLQTTIEDIIEKYQEGSLTYEQAEQQILSATYQYSPGILASYETEKKAIQETAIKKLEEAEITKLTAENNLENTKKSNEEIVQSYINLYTNMVTLLSGLNIAMNDFAKNTSNMASSVSSSISSLQSSMKALSKIENTLSSTVSSSKINASLTKISDEQTQKLISIGSALLDKPLNSALINSGIGAAVPYVTTKNNTSNNAVSFTGDIIVNSNGDVNALSKDIVSQLPGAMLQTIFKHTT